MSSYFSRPWQICTIRQSALIFSPLNLVCVSYGSLSPSLSKTFSGLADLRGSELWAPDRPTDPGTRVFVHHVSIIFQWICLAYLSLALSLFPSLDLFIHLRVRQIVYWVEQDWATKERKALVWERESSSPWQKFEPNLSGLWIMGQIWANPSHFWPLLGFVTLLKSREHK